MPEYLIDTSHSFRIHLTNVNPLDETYDTWIRYIVWNGSGLETQKEVKLSEKNQKSFNFELKVLLPSLYTKYFDDNYEKLLQKYFLMELEVV
jgi:hypothetical protein